MVNSTRGKGTKTDAATLSEVAQKLNLAARQRFALTPQDLLPPLLLLSDEARLPDPAPALEALPAGSGFIFRHYNDPYRKERAARLRDLARSRGVVFLVAGDIDLAIALEADGCHLPEHRMQDLGLCHNTFSFNTVAAHSSVALEAACAGGASAALLSPVFATKSHAGASGLGVKAATALARDISLPVYALGGVNARTAASLANSAFAGFAAIEGLSGQALSHRD